MEMRSLRRQPHDLVTLELVVMLVGPNSFILQRLDQARSRALVLDDKVGGRPVDFPLSVKRRCGGYEFGILEPAADEIHQQDFVAAVLDPPDGARRNSRRARLPSWRYPS